MCIYKRIVANIAFVANRCIKNAISWKSYLFPWNSIPRNFDVIYVLFKARVGVFYQI